LVAAAKPDAAIRQTAMSSCNAFFTLISVLRYVDACIGAIAAGRARRSRIFKQMLRLS
jgi:hypothetical protein